MIGWMVAHAPGAYLIGTGVTVLGGALLLHLWVEWRRVILARRCAQQSRYRQALRDAKRRHPSSLRRPGRVVWRVARAVAPTPRQPLDQQPWTVAAAMSLPVSLYGTTIPAQHPRPES